jgi:hypothetical protein
VSAEAVVAGIAAGAVSGTAAGAVIVYGLTRRFMRRPGPPGPDGEGDQACGGQDHKGRGAAGGPNSGKFV